jgi:hypothetical protein
MFELLAILDLDQYVKESRVPEPSPMYVWLPTDVGKNWFRV